MRLGFYYHIPAIISQNKILCPGYLGRFLDSLASYFDLSLFLHEPNPKEASNFDYAIKSQNVCLVQLPPRKSFPYRLIHQKRFLRIITRHSNNLDGFLIRGPSPLLPSIARSVDTIPRILLLIGDYLAGINSLPQPAWRKTIIHLVEWLNYRGQLNVARQCLVFVNSHILFKNYQGIVRNLFETRTTTLTSQDFFYREDTCLTRPVHILYTGRMDPSKGLFDMIQAVALLVKQGEDVVLDLVGWPDGNPNIIEELMAEAKKESIQNRILFHGYKAIGPDLFNFYKEADIYLIASQSSEGFPRTIWEAMAHSLPVVATKVGSIPDFIPQEAELVEPNNPAELAKGVSRLLHSQEKRRDLISKGLVLARQNSLENQVGEMARVIKKWVTSEHE